jgi:hypothetical protein
MNGGGFPYAGGGVLPKAGGLPNAGGGAGTAPPGGTGGGASPCVSTIGDVPGLYAGGDIIGTGWPRDAAPAVSGGRFALIQIPSCANPMASQDARTIQANQNLASVLSFLISVLTPPTGSSPVFTLGAWRRIFHFLEILLLLT